MNLILSETPAARRDGSGSFKYLFGHIALLTKGVSRAMLAEVWLLIKSGEKHDQTYLRNG